MNDGTSSTPTAASRPPKPFLNYFRRSLKFVWPHRRYLFASFVAALGVMTFYTAGMGALYPILTAMMSDHETLPDSVYRELANHRLGVTAEPDVRHGSTNQGISVWRVNGERDDEAAVARPIQPDDTITAVGGDQGDCYVLYRKFVRHESDTITLTVRPAGAPETNEPITVRLEPSAVYVPALTTVVDLIDFGPEPPGRIKGLAVVMGLFVTFSGLQLFCRFWQQYLVELTASRALMDLRTQGYAHVLQLPMDFFARRKTGETMTRFGQDTAVLLLGIRTIFGKAVREPLKAVGVLVLVLVVAGGPLLLIVLVTALPAAFLVRRFGRIIRRAQRRALEAWDGLLEMLQERIGAIRVVKGYTMERAERLRFFREHQRLFKNQLRVQRFDVATSPILEFLAIVVVSSFVLYGGSLVFNGESEASGFLETVVLLVALFDPLRKLSNVNNRLQQADAAAARIFDILDEPVETRTIQSPHATPLPRHRERIEFRNVSFRYASRPDVPVLQNVNLTVEAGQTVAIVGPNGSGKTTLCALLLRFYGPDEGAVLIDGHDIRDATLDSLRRQIGLVTQDTVIFTDTVAANIAYGQRHVDRDTVRRAAETAYADEFIAHLTSPPSHSRNGQPPATGYDAVIAANTLSGGQKQRLAIARALVRNPSILIFDEATSQIDPDSARKIHDAIRAVRRNRTAFVIAHHDRDILPEADQVVVMDAGRIVAVGRHEELLQTSALYKNLYEVQFRVPAPAGEAPDER